MDVLVVGRGDSASERVVGRRSQCEKYAGYHTHDTSLVEPS